MARIIVIGGGIGGLASAALLAHTGHEVVLVEKNEQLGGRASVLRQDGFVFDMGPSWYLGPDIFERFFALLDEKPSDHYELTQLDPAYRLVFADRIIDIRSDSVLNEELFASLEPDGAQKLRSFLAEAKRLYEDSRFFLEKEYRTPLDMLDPRLARIGMSFELFRSLERFIARRFSSEEARRILMYTIVFLGGSPKNTPGIYSLMSHMDLGLGVWYPQGGITSLVAALERIARDRGVTVRLNEPVKRIVVTDGRATGVEIEGEILTADHVVANADYHHVETQLLDTAYRSYDEAYWGKRTVAPSAFLLYLGVEGVVENLAHHTLLLEHDWQQHFNDLFEKPSWPQEPSMYVCAPSKTDPSVAPEGSESLFVLVPVAAGLRDTPKIRARYRELVLDELERTTGPIRDRIRFERSFSVADFSERYNAYRGTALGLSHTLMQTGSFRPLQRSKKVANLSYVGHFTHPGVGVPMVLISAQIVARIIGDAR
jgi:1-hydroxy-2-isopentenylcarotenoid 3,4-desaturase